MSSLRALRDGSSRYNTLVSSRRRQSIGGANRDDEITPQKPHRGLLGGAVSSSGNRALSAPRRLSMGGASMAGDTPTRDRRAMLEAWRQARNGNRAGDEIDSKKRNRIDPPLPPSAALTPTSRKFQRTGSTLRDVQSHSQQTPGSIDYYDDEMDNYSRGSSLLSSRTSIGRTGKLGTARRQSLLGKSIGQPCEGMSLT